MEGRTWKYWASSGPVFYIPRVMLGTQDYREEVSSRESTVQYTLLVMYRVYSFQKSLPPPHERVSTVQRNKLSR